jgi:nitroreductase
MKVSEALAKRKSTRAFLNKTVDVEKIKRILNAAKQAPSGVNAQPWQVAVVMGKKKKLLEQCLEKAYRSGIKGQMDYQYYPCEWHEPYKTRRKACGLQLYTALEISRDDKEKQRESNGLPITGHLMRLSCFFSLWIQIWQQVHFWIMACFCSQLCWQPLMKG